MKTWNFFGRYNWAREAFGYKSWNLCPIYGIMFLVSSTEACRVPLRQTSLQDLNKSNHRIPLLPRLSIGAGL